MVEGSIWLLKIIFGSCIFLRFSKKLGLFDQFHKEIVNNFTEYFTLISCLKILCRIQKSSQVCVLSKHISKLKMLIAFDWGLYLICECYFWRLHFPIILIQNVTDLKFWIKSLKNFMINEFTLHIYKLSTNRNTKHL